MSGAEFAILSTSRATTNAQAASIKAALVAWWDFEENGAGTQFLDAHGTNHLSIRTGASSTASSAASTASGKVNRAFYINNVTNLTAYIPRINTALDLPNTDHSYGGWFVGSGGAGTARFCMGRIGSGGAIQSGLIQDSDSLASDVFLASADGSTLVKATGAVSVSTYRLFIASFDRTNNLIRFRYKSNLVDGNVTTAFPSALYTTASNANFCISGGLSGDSTFFSGGRQLAADSHADSCFYRSGVTTESEFLYLYNSGTGKNYAQLVADAG